MDSSSSTSLIVVFLLVPVSVLTLDSCACETDVLMPRGMSDKKCVHKSPDQGMTKTRLLHSHLKTRSFLQLLLLFLCDVSEIDAI